MSWEQYFSFLCRKAVAKHLNTFEQIVHRVLKGIKMATCLDKDLMSLLECSRLFGGDDGVSTFLFCPGGNVARMEKCQIKESAERGRWRWAWGLFP